MQTAIFNELVRSVYSPLKAYVARKVPADDIDDVLQEAFAAIWKADYPDPQSESDRARLRGFLYRIADRRAADFWRSKARRDRKFLAATNVLRATPDTVPSALDEVVQGTPPAWLQELSNDALEVLLRFVDGASVTEIAAELEISVNAVSSRLKRIRTRVPGLLNKEVADEHNA